MKTEQKIAFEHEDKQVIQEKNKFFTRITEGTECFESGDFNTLERAKQNIDIKPTKEEENKIIALFMGYVESGFEGKRLYNREVSQKEINPKDLRYDCDWSWLMEVVEKLENMGVIVTINRMACKIVYQDLFNKELNFEIEIVCGVKINAVHGAIIRLLNWYNEQK